MLRSTLQYRWLKTSEKKIILHSMGDVQVLLEFCQAWCVWPLVRAWWKEKVFKKYFLIMSAYHNHSWNLKITCGMDCEKSVLRPIKSCCLGRTSRPCTPRLESQWAVELHPTPASRAESITRHRGLATGHCICILEHRRQHPSQTAPGIAEGR